MLSPFANVKELEAFLRHNKVLQPGQPHERLAGGGERARTAVIRRLFHGLSPKAGRKQMKQTRCRPSRQGGHKQKQPGSRKRHNKQACVFR